MAAGGLLFVNELTYAVINGNKRFFQRATPLFLCIQKIRNPRCRNPNGIFFIPPAGILFHQYAAFAQDGAREIVGVGMQKHDPFDSAVDDHFSADSAGIVCAV